MMGRKITIFFILAGALMQASSFGDIIPANRRIAWSRSIVGVPGGIPNRTKIFADVTQSPYRADKTGTSDASAKIQAAIEACPENQVVYLPAGTYRIDKPIDFRQKKKITLRGAGTSTLLVDHTSGGNAMISIGGRFGTDARFRNRDYGRTEQGFRRGDGRVRNWIQRGNAGGP